MTTGKEGEPRRAVPRLARALAASALAGVAVAGVFLWPRRSGLPLAPSLEVESMTVEASAYSDVEAPETPPRQPRQRPFNVVLITIDTLRFDLGYMGYPRAITPNIDALARRSTVFERAYATASYTPKSMGPLLSGRYASEMPRDGAHYTTFYPANTFLAERVREAGGRTLAAMCHHYFRWPTGFEQGFDVWDTSATPAVASDNDPTLTSERLTDAALALLARPEDAAPNREARDGGPAAGRFLAWVHYTDPHGPYVPHADAPRWHDAGAKVGYDPRAAYDDEVWYTDKHVGRLLDFIAAQPWAAETAIVLTSDHGEAFGEHGFLRHGRELWEVLVRVPLVLHVPGAAPGRVALKRSHVDLVPTILDLMGISAAEAGLAGKSLLTDVVAPSDAEREERDVFLDMPAGPYNEARRAVIHGSSPGTKLIQMNGDRFELYDLAKDPDERTDRHAEAERLRPVMSSFQRLRATLQEVEAQP